jgi:hypothetical protein
MIRAFLSDRQRAGLFDVAVTSLGRKGVRPGATHHIAYWPGASHDAVKVPSDAVQPNVLKPTSVILRFLPDANNPRKARPCDASRLIPMIGKRGRAIGCQALDLDRRRRFRLDGLCLPQRDQRR